MAQITLVWDEAAIKLIGNDPRVMAALDRVAAQAVRTMKTLAPVSPVYPVYAQPVPLGRSTGPVYGGTHKGVRWQKGQDRPRRRLPGDLPLNVSGRMRQSIRAIRMGPGEIIIGPHVHYAAYVNDGTRPHIIRSHGNWPLRNRISGQVFGRVVHHPGTRGAHFIERTAESLNGERVRA